MEAWIRTLNVTLIADLGSAGQKRITFRSDDEISIEATGTKYMKPDLDEFTVIIKNVPTSNADYSIQYIKDIDFRYIVIEAGYRDSSAIQIFSGYIVYVSSIREDKNTTMSMIITCSGSYTYNNLTGHTFTVKRGISYYDALMVGATMSKIQSANISLSKSLRYKRLDKDLTFDGTFSGMITELQKRDNNLLCHCDFSSDTKFNVWDATVYSPRVMHLNQDNIVLANGFPTIEDQGITMTCLPVFNFIPGDEVILDDNTFVNISITSLSAYTSSPYPEIYVGEVSPLETNQERIKEIENAKGHYFIRELRYNLASRGNNFTVTMKCYAKSIYSSIAQNWSEA